MGTTATVTLVDERAGISVAHVGDSPLPHRFRGQHPRAADDRPLARRRGAVRSRRLTEDEAAVHPHRSVITRALGTEAEVDVDTLTVELRPHDLVSSARTRLSAMVRDVDSARARRYGRRPAPRRGR